MGDGGRRHSLLISYLVILYFCVLFSPSFLLDCHVLFPSLFLLNCHVLFPPPLFLLDCHVCPLGGGVRLF